MIANPTAWVFALGLAVRGYSATTRCIVNPDSAQYIFQASAIFNGNWSNVLSCKISYISPLPLFIATAFGFFRDWIFATQSVNILFGWAALFPLYFILRRFTDKTVATLTILIYALMPVLVEGSANALRGPIFWFCMSMGMLMFIRQWDGKALSRRFRVDLLLSSLFFMMGAWARIEGAVFLPMSPIYILVARGDKKIQRCLVFLFPLILGGLVAAGIGLYSGQKDMATTTRIDQVFHEITQFAGQYDALNDQVKKVAKQNKGLFGRYLQRTREVLMFIPFPSILYNILEGIFYPFALVFFIGFAGLTGLFRQNRRQGYLLVLSATGFVVLYVHMLQTWIIDYRFLAIMIFPACIIMANGAGRVIGYLQHTRGLSPRKAVTILTAFLILFGLPKSLKPEEQDKIVFRQAALAIAYQKKPGQLVGVGAADASRHFEWVLLYAHRKSSNLFCALQRVVDIPKTYEPFKAVLDRSGNQYFFYEESHWPQNGFDLMTAPYQQDFRLLGQWQHPDSGSIAVFKRITEK